MDRKQTGTERESVLRLATGSRLTQTIYVGAKLGITDRLARGSQPPASLAEEVGVHPDRLNRVLRALAG